MNVKKIVENNKIAISIVFTIIYFIFIHIININFDIKNCEIIGALTIGITIIVTNFIVIKQYEKDKKIDYKKIIVGITIVGIILRTVYILYTPITDRQHDMEANVGHLAYIETIYETGKLPNHNKWQFYQQPLHHIIAAGWLKINSFFGVDLEKSKEGIQNLTAIYSSLIIVITYCILKEMNIKDWKKLLVLGIVAVHPTFIILSGSINNDILSVMLTMLSILYLMKWYKESSMKNTIILAILTGLVALTKIAGTIIAIPILYIFIDKFFKDYFDKKDKKVIKNYVVKFAIFGIIALGLGLSFSIRNMILFNQSIFYVPVPGSSVYKTTFFDRISIISNEWGKIYCNPFKDSNIIVYLIKSSLFGEFCIVGNYGSWAAIVLLVINCILIVITLVSIVKILVNIKKEKSKLLLMLMVFYITEMIMYMYGNITMPYTCTMDFRYIIPTIIWGIIFIVESLPEEINKYSKITSITILLFAVVSVFFELIYMSGLEINKIYYI